MKGMGRPREFSEEEVLDAALEAFWSRGFEATSVQDLVDATGLSRASLYGAFGDKEALFEAVLAHYAARTARIARELEEAPSARAGIERFMLRFVEGASAPGGPRGCFMQLSVSECQPARPAVARAAAEGARQTEEGLLRALQRGKKAGELPASLEAKATARLLAVTLQGVAAAARAGRSREELREVVRQAVRLLG